MPATCIFLSYSRKNSNYARTLHDRLEASHVTVWWDQEEAPGSDWTEQLLVWLEEAHAVVVVVDQYSVIAPSVKNEILLAQDYQQRVIPVLLEQARGGLWVLIRSLQWIDARENRDPVPALLEALQVDQYSVIGPNNQTHQTPPPAASTTQAQITITFPGDINDFDNYEQSSLVQIVARFAKLSPEQIKVVRVEAGSIHITLELPESSARWLLKMYDERASLVDLLDIQSVHHLQVLPINQNADAKPNTTNQFIAWFQNRTRVYALALAGTFVTVILVMGLFTSLQTPASQIEPSVGIVSELQGTLEMRRAGWDAFTPVAVGTQLAEGDRLQLDVGAQASIVCADGTIIEAQSDMRDFSCSSDASLLLFDIDQAQWANAVLSANNVDVPQVITPRATTLLTTTPTIRWTAIEGVNTYTVILRREGEDVWSETVNDTPELTYPPSQLPLEPGPIYQFIVIADNGPEEIAQGAGVQVLDEQESQTVEATVQRVIQQGLDDATTQVLLANVYANQGLYAAALALLDPLDDTTTSSIDPKLLGDIYVAIGLPHLAIEPYMQAHEIAEETNDQLGQAQINQMLGVVYSQLGGEDNRAQAIKHYRQALQFYQEVGDTNVQTELRQRIDGLE